MYRYPYQNSQLSAEQRADDLLERMSLQDKAGLLFHAMTFAGDIDSANTIFPLRPPQKLITKYGLRHFSVFASLPDGRAFAEWHNALQRIAAAHPLAIPLTLSSDPRHHFTDNPLASVIAGPFSQWPEPLGLAAIGSEELVREFADIARQEYLAVGLRVALHPQIDLATEPRWCRISSTLGEDADLTARLAVAYIRGFQTEILGADSVATMTKHFPGGGPQKDGEDPHFPWGREQVYPGGNFDYHLEPFRAAIKAGTSQIMPYYSMPVGTAHEEVGFSFNKSVITGLLREDLGFDGIICTDWGLVNDKPGGGDIGRAKAWGVEHLDEDQRLLKLLDAGVDQFGGEYCSDRLVRLVQAGHVTENRIDRSAKRILREKFVLGLFDRPYVDENRAALVLGASAFRSAGLRAQQRAVTLLTNEPSASGSPTLPLPRGVRAYGEGFTNEILARYAIIVDDPSQADVALVRLKTPWVPNGKGGMAENFHGGSLEFPPVELERLVGICESVPTVIDIHLERPAVLGSLVASAAAIVANYGIVESALLDVLFGEASPEGNLPCDLPRSMDAVLESRSDVPFDTADPVFRFGHGLRYVKPQ
jgi:beta-glucosidase